MWTRYESFVVFGEKKHIFISSHLEYQVAHIRSLSSINDHIKNAYAIPLFNLQFGTSSFFFFSLIIIIADSTPYAYEMVCCQRVLNYRLAI